MKALLNRFLAIAAVTAAFALPSVQAADDPVEPTPPGAGIGRALARELDLSREQRNALKNVVRTHQPMLRPLFDQAQAERATLRDLIAAPTLDENALAAQAERIAANHRDIVIASARLRVDLRKVLTAEQLAKLEGWRAGAKARMKSGRAWFRAALMEP